VAELFARGTKVALDEDAQKVIDDLHWKIGQRAARGLRAEAFVAGLGRSVLRKWIF